MSTLRIRNRARVKELNISNDKIEAARAKIKKCVTKSISPIIRSITGAGPCCVCSDVPSFEVSYRVHGVKVLEYYCRMCINTVYTREEQEPKESDKLAEYYNCKIGSIY